MRILPKMMQIVVWLTVLSMALGGAWTSKRITNNDGDSREPDIAANGANIFVVWHDFTSGNPEIYFKKSIDGGGTWQTSKRLTNNTGYSRSPAIASGGANLFVAWSDDTPGSAEIYFRRSTDGGATWQTQKRLSNNADVSYSPVIAVSGTNVIVAWLDHSPGNWTIYTRRSADNGVTWQPSVRMTYTAGSSMYPAIAGSGGNVCVTWHDFTSGDGEIYLKKSTDGGATWKPNKRLTDNSGSSESSAIALNGANVYVAWSDNTPGNYDIYFMRSTDGGATWQTAKRLTNNPGTSYKVDIAVSGANVYVAWEDDTPETFDEIYFRRSADNGSTWQGAERLTDTSGVSAESAVAANSAKVFVVWEDDTPGNHDIYLKHSPL